MPGLDVFNSNAFSMQSLTARLLDRAHRPMRLGEMGLFQAEGVRTTSISVERQGNTLVLVQTTPRNAPAVQNTKDSRTLRSFDTVRIALEDSVTADEVQNVRAFGSETEVDTFLAEIDRRADRMSGSIGVTEEFHRIGALKGLILDADGATILDLNAAFGVSAQSEVDFAMDVGDSPTERSLTDKISAIIRTIEDELDGLPYTGIHAMCSSQFFDDLVGHPAVRDIFKGYAQGAEPARERKARTGRVFPFGGVDFEEYRGTVGGTKYVADNKAHFFPIGVPELFITRYAPAEYIETVGTVGLPRYVFINPDGSDPKHKRTVRVQSQAIHLMTRPRAQVLAKRT